MITNAETARTASLDRVMRAKKTDNDRQVLSDLIEATKHLPGKLISRDADYEVAWYVEDNFRIIIYPHKTSAGNYHFRIRAQGDGCKSIQCRYVMAVMHESRPHDINFQWKGMGAASPQQIIKKYRKNQL